MAFKYTADYYDPSQPTEEEGAKEPGEAVAAAVAAAAAEQHRLSAALCVAICRGGGA